MNIFNRGLVSLQHTRQLLKCLGSNLIPLSAVHHSKNLLRGSLRFSRLKLNIPKN